MQSLKALVLSVVFAFAVSGLALPISLNAAPGVYGKPGEGRIHVETKGGPDRWKHPGVYWLPQGTTLLEFIKRARPKNLLGDGTDQPTILIYQGGKARGSFHLPFIRPGTPKGEFLLEDGDVLSTVPVLS